MARRFAVLLMVLCVVLAACSDSGDDATGSSTTTTLAAKDWDRSATAVVTRVASRVRAGFPAQCKDLAPVPRQVFVDTATKVKLDIPLALSSCTTAGEEIEFSVWPSPAARDAAVDNRLDVLCRRAKDAKFDLAGLHWVTGGRWAVQVDSEGLGRRLATALRATYDVAPCPGQEQIDWDPAAVTQVEQLAGTLAGDPRIECTNFQLLDRSTYAHNPEYKDRLPAAYARCNGPSGATIWIAAFSDKTVTPDAFAAAEAKYFCTSLNGVVGVRGDDFAIVATQLQVGARAAVVTGGTALDPAC